MSRLSRLTLGLVLVTTAATGCSEDTGPVRASESPTAASSSSAAPYAAIDDPNANLDLRAIGRRATAVIVGTVAQRQDGVKGGDDPNVSYTTYTVQVQRSLRGSAAQTVKVTMMTSVAGEPLRVDGRPDLGVGSSAIWAITPLDPASGYEGYRLTTTFSLFGLDSSKTKIASSGTDEKAAALLEAQRLGDSERVESALMS